MQQEIKFIYCRYKPESISVTENGFMVKGEDFMSMEEILNDTKRVQYFKDYIRNAVEAVVYDGVSSLISQFIN